MTVTINGTTGIAGTNGSAGTPAVQGEDTNTGIFFPAADTVAVATAGTEQLRVNSSGDVGIGTTSPGRISTGIRTLELKGDDAAQPDRSGGVRYTRQDGTVAMLMYHGDGANSIVSASTYPLTFDTGGAERARIDSDGNLLVGLSTSSGYRFQAFTGALTAVARFGRTTDATARSAIVLYSENQATGVGSIQVTNTATSYVTSSDYRLKENVQPMTGALDKIAQLNPVTYTWKADGTLGQGFIAHELQAVVPDCVTGEKDAVDAEGNPQYQGVDTSFLVATLVKAIQELTARVAQLEAQ